MTYRSGCQWLATLENDFLDVLGQAVMREAQETHEQIND
jgi:hypothetical protein